MKFRNASGNDTPALKVISRRVITTNYTSFLGDAATVFVESGAADAEIDKGLGNCTVMLIANTIIGFAIIDADLLHLIMVDVPYQGRGYGKLLLAHIEKSLFDNFDSIRLQSFKENSNTVQFYLKTGWKVTAEQYVPDMEKTMLFFEKVNKPRK